MRKADIRTRPDAQNPPAAVSKPNPVKSPRQARRSWIVIALRLGHPIRKVSRLADQRLQLEHVFIVSVRDPTAVLHHLTTSTA